MKTTLPEKIVEYFTKKFRAGGLSVAAANLRIMPIPEMETVIVNFGGEDHVFSLWTDAFEFLTILANLTPTIPCRHCHGNGRELS